MTITVHAIPGDARRLFAHCAACGGARTIVLPLPASRLLEELDAFRKMHDHDQTPAAHETR
jgi:hypothetical protein